MSFAFAWVNLWPAYRKKIRPRCQIAIDRIIEGDINEGDINALGALYPESMQGSSTPPGILQRLQTGLGFESPQHKAETPTSL